MSSADPGRTPKKFLEEVGELLAEDASERVTEEEAWRILSTAVRFYAAKREAGAEPVRFSGEEDPTATDVVVAVTDLLRAADIELFELGMWQVWGRP